MAAASATAGPSRQSMTSWQSCWPGKRPPQGVRACVMTINSVETVRGARASVNDFAPRTTCWTSPPRATSSSSRRRSSACYRATWAVWRSRWSRRTRLIDRKSVGCSSPAAAELSDVQDVMTSWPTAALQPRARPMPHATFWVARDRWTVSRAVVVWLAAASCHPEARQEALKIVRRSGSRAIDREDTWFNVRLAE